MAKNKDVGFKENYNDPRVLKVDIVDIAKNSALRRKLKDAVSKDGKFVKNYINDLSLEETGNHLLHYLVMEKHIEYEKLSYIFKRLFEVGADLNVRNKDDKTPLQLACELGESRVVESLVRRGKPKYEDLETVFESIRDKDCGDFSQIKEFLEEQIRELEEVKNVEGENKEGSVTKVKMDEEAKNQTILLDGVDFNVKLVGKYLDELCGVCDDEGMRMFVRKSISDANIDVIKLAVILGVNPQSFLTYFSDIERGFFDDEGNLNDKDKKELVELRKFLDARSKKEYQDISFCKNKNGIPDDAYDNLVSDIKKVQESLKTKNNIVAGIYELLGDELFDFMKRSKEGEVKKLKELLTSQSNNSVKLKEFLKDNNLKVIMAASEDLSKFMRDTFKVDIGKALNVKDILLGMWSEVSDDVAKERAKEEEQKEEQKGAKVKKTISREYLDATDNQVKQSFIGNEGLQEDIRKLVDFSFRMGRKSAVQKEQNFNPQLILDYINNIFKNNENLHAFLSNQKVWDAYSNLGIAFVNPCGYIKQTLKQFNLQIGSNNNVTSDMVRFVCHNMAKEECKRRINNLESDEQKHDLIGQKENNNSSLKEEVIKFCEFKKNYAEQAHRQDFNKDVLLKDLEEQFGSFASLRKSLSFYGAEKIYPSLILSINGSKVGSTEKEVLSKCREVIDQWAVEQGVKKAVPSRQNQLNNNNQNRHHRNNGRGENKGNEPECDYGLINNKTLEELNSRKGKSFRALLREFVKSKIDKGLARGVIEKDLTLCFKDNKNFTDHFGNNVGSLLQKVEKSFSKELNVKDGREKISFVRRACYFVFFKCDKLKKYLDEYERPAEKGRKQNPNMVVLDPSSQPFANKLVHQVE